MLTTNSVEMSLDDIHNSRVEVVIRNHVHSQPIWGLIGNGFDSKGCLVSFQLSGHWDEAQTAPKTFNRCYDELRIFRLSRTGSMPDRPVAVVCASGPC